MATSAKTIAKKRSTVKKLEAQFAKEKAKADKKAKAESEFKALAQKEKVLKTKIGSIKKK